jgi:multiple sugar transport system substrate-binding protein
MPDTRLSRRTLLKLMGTGLALAACAPMPPPEAGPAQVVQVPTGESLEGFTPKLSDPAQAPIELTYWWGNEYEPALEFTNEIIGRFSLAYPDVKVDPVAGQNCDTFVTAAAAGTPPDLFHTWDCVERMGNWANRGLIISIDDFIEADDFPLDDYFSGIMDTCRMDGKTWGMVDTAGVFLLWSRPPLCEQIGQESTATPADTDEMWEWARELTQLDNTGDITQLGMGLPSWTWEYFTWIVNFGGVLWDPAANEPTPEHPGVLAALADLVSQVEFYGVDTLERWSAGMGAQSGAQDPWLAGQMGMKISGDWTGQSIFDFFPDWEFGTDYAAAAPPPPPASKQHGDSAVAWWSWPWVIPGGTEHPEWSWELLRYYLSPEYQVNVHAKFKEILVRDSMADDERLWWPAASVAREIARGGRALTTVMPMNPVADEYSNLLGEAIGNVVRLTETPEAAMARVKEETLRSLQSG